MEPTTCALCQRQACVGEAGRELCLVHAATTQSAGHVADPQVLAKQRRVLRALVVKVWDELCDNASEPQPSLAPRPHAASSLPRKPASLGPASSSTTTGAAPPPPQQQQQQRGHKRTTPGFPLLALNLAAAASGGPEPAVAPGASSREPPPGGIRTGAFQCPNCASSDCAYVFLRDARDVAKADTWGSSDRAASVRRFACLACGHSWMREEG